MQKNLPEKIFIIPNPDKDYHEGWIDGRHKGNLPHPFRLMACGPPNVGKTNNVKNLLALQWPPFEKIIVVHLSPGTTKEYDDIKCILIKEIPDPDDFDMLNGKKCAVILDDIDFRGLGKQQQECLSRLFGSVSTHKDVSVFLLTQDPMSVHITIRRCANAFMIWKMHETIAMKTILRQAGLMAGKQKKLIPLLTKPTDSLLIDNTLGSPYPLRLNIYNVIGEKVKEIKGPVSATLPYNPYTKITAKEIREMEKNK